MLAVVDYFAKRLLSRVRNVCTVCLIGSASTGIDFDENSDIDVVIIVDDSSPFVEREQASADIKDIAKSVNEKLHCQVMFLTDFWRYVDTGSPVTFTILRDAKIYFDTGFFSTLQRLVNAKAIKPKKAAVERQLEIAKQLMKMTYHSVNSGLLQNLEGAVISSTQSLLMEMGIEPPAPKHVPDAIKSQLVSKGILNEQYYNIARKVVQTYKDVEHGKRQNVSGVELQQLYNETNTFVNAIERILSELRNKR
jgi:predicted nucleotidyltransferase